MSIINLMCCKLDGGLQLLTGRWQTSVPQLRIKTVKKKDGGRDPFFSCTGCANKFWRSEKFFEQNERQLKKYFVFCSKKLLFQPFLGTARNDNGFLSHFSPISNNLLNKLLHMIIGEKLPKNSSFIFAVDK